MSEQVYKDTANELVERIRALIPDNPQIMEMGEPMNLLKIDGFDYEDLQPSYYQVAWALAKAKTLEAQNEGEVAS